LDLQEIQVLTRSVRAMTEPNAAAAAPIPSISAVAATSTMTIAAAEGPIPCEIPVAGDGDA
jgi:hypothetical protein